MNKPLDSYVSEIFESPQKDREAEKLPATSDRIFAIVAEGELTDHLNDGWTLVDRWITRVDRMVGFDQFLYMYLIAKDRPDTEMNDFGYSGVHKIIKL